MIGGILVFASLVLPGKQESWKILTILHSSTSSHPKEPHAQAGDGLQVAATCAAGRCH
jgi:hypothetical protein